jgi:hypothetical protein
MEKDIQSVEAPAEAMARMPHTEKSSCGVRISILLDPEEADLFEAWRQQHRNGQRSRASALRFLLDVYFGLWPGYCNAPGYGSAWEKRAGWEELVDPRSEKNACRPAPLRLV